MTSMTEAETSLSLGALAHFTLPVRQANVTLVPSRAKLFGLPLKDAVRKLNPLKTRSPAG